MVYGKHAPNEIDDLILPSGEVRDRLRQYKEGVRRRSLILHGPYGSGKSTAAGVTASPTEQAGDASVYQGADINKSSFDTMINDMSYQRCVLGARDPKIVIEEVDQLSPELQRQLRAHIDKYSDLGSFIMTTNHISNVDAGLRSRCDQIDMPYADSDAWQARAKEILAAEGVDIDEELLKEIMNETGDYRDKMQAIEDVVIKSRES